MSRDRDRALAESDAVARALAQREFVRPLLLEAGAGTGKTTTLVARVLAWSLGRGWSRAEAALRDDAGSDELPPERIAAQILRRAVAITFTEAAAAEMSVRVGEALLQVERGAAPPWLLAEALPANPGERRVRARALRGALDHLIVQTIHAYCRRLLVTHPLEARLHPRLEIDADGRLQSEAVREVLEERLADAYTGAGDADLLALAERGIGPRELEEELLLLLGEGLGAAALEPDPVAPARVTALFERLRARLEAFREVGGARLHAAGGAAADAVACVDRVLALCAEGSQGEAALAGVVEALRETWPGRNRSRLKNWGREQFTKKEALELGSAAPELPTAASALVDVLDHVGSLDLELLALGRRVLGGLLAETESLLRARGIATFSALLSGARALLVDAPGVAARVRARIDQLVVDEFQDTDRRQCDIVRAIALEGPPEDRPGLFVVGDPKQSIYGWRNADLAAYQGFVDTALAAGGTREHLSVNYRSAPPILDEVERAVAPVMVERRAAQPAFEPLAPCPEREADPLRRRRRPRWTTTVRPPPPRSSRRSTSHPPRSTPSPAAPSRPHVG